VSNNKTRWEAESPPNVLLAIDPGASFPKSKVPYAGVALFQWGELVWGALVKCPTTASPFAQANTLVRKVCTEARVARHDKDLGEALTVLAVENPLLYKRGAASPTDIIALKGIYGAFMGGVDAEFYSGPTPVSWKGSIDGVILNERVLKILNGGERLMLMNAQRMGHGGLTDHVLDAVGLGLYVLGRMSTGGVV
jgi:hypothetical protein